MREVAVSIFQPSPNPFHIYMRKFTKYYKEYCDGDIWQGDLNISFSLEGCISRFFKEYPKSNITFPDLQSKTKYEERPLTQQFPSGCHQSPRLSKLPKAIKHINFNKSTKKFFKKQFMQGRVTQNSQNQREQNRVEEDRK